MARFNIDVLASQCGVTPANIRSWQRYGLIKPQVDENGHRFFDMTHCSQVADIVGWLGKGASLPHLPALLSGEAPGLNCGWLDIQEALLAQCELMQPTKVRSLIWRYGRELPPGIFIDEVIRPLRLWMNSSVRHEMTMSSAVLDSALFEYATFVLASGRKRPGGSLFMLALSLKDRLEFWLEAIRYASDGFRVELFDSVVVEPDLSQIDADHILIWSDNALTRHQQAAYDRWLKDGRPVFLVGPVRDKKRQSARISLSDMSTY